MEAQTTTTAAAATRKFYLLLSCSLTLIGSSGGPLITRLYFIHGGSRMWVSSFSQTAAFPIILIPLCIAYAIRRRRSSNGKAKLFLIKPFLFMSSVGIGILMGALDYMYAFGSSKLPVSTTTLIAATQLAFTATFAFFLVKQKFTPYSLNTVVLMTIGAAVLGLHASSDRPEGETKKEYVMGFLMMSLTALLLGFILPLMELCYRKAKQTICFTLAMEFTMILCFSATAFCTVGMLINNDFKAIVREAREYELGEVKYYVVVVFNAITWQFQLVGANGVIFCASSLLSGVLMAVAVPITEVLAVIFFHEKFQVEKGVSLLLSLWGFASYFYGEMRDTTRTKSPPLELQEEDSINGGSPNMEVHHRESTTQLTGLPQKAPNSRTPPGLMGSHQQKLSSPRT